MRLLRRNIGWTYLSWAATLASGLVVTPVVVRSLGAEEYGVWAVVGSLAAYLALLDLGLAPTVIRFAAEARGRRSQEEASAIASVGLVLYSAIGVLATLVGLGLAWLVPVFVDVPDDLVTPARVAAALLVVSMAVRFPLGLFGNLLLGQQRYDVVSAASFASTVAYTVLVLVLLPGGGGVVMLSAVSLTAGLLRLAVPLFWVRRELGSVRPRRRHLTRERLLKLLTVSGDNVLIHAAARIVFTSDVIVVGIALGPEAAAFYAVPAKLFAIAFGVGTAGTNLLFPAFAELEGAEEDARQRALLRDGLRSGMAAALIFTLPLLLFPDRLIEAWIGAGFEESTSVMVILAAALLLQLPIHVTSQYLVARGLQHPVALVSIAAAAANVTLSVALSLTVGIWGVALSTLVTNAAVVLVILRLTGRASGLGGRALLIAAGRPVLPALGAGVLVFGTARAFGATEVPAVVLAGAVWVVLGAAAIWRLGLDHSLRSAVRRRVRRGDEPEPLPTLTGAEY